MWFLQHAHEASTHRAGHLHMVDVQTHCLFVQQTQYHPLAMGGRQGRHPHIHFVAGQAQADPAILRHALLGDVQARHDLDARNQQCR
ncbi:hypothetical protein D3C75_1092070 [compost metagenome]